MASDILGAAGATGATGAAAARGGNNPAGRSAADLGDQFMTLLVAQVKNQDPLNPMKNAEFTSQIAQINTVSGINGLNDTLANINGQIDTSQQLQASALIGRDVLVPGDRIQVGEDGAAMPFGMDLDRSAAKVEITVTDDSGEVMYESSYDNQPAGVQSFAWDGKDASGAVVDPGSYRVSVKATDAEGNAIAARTLATGRVSGVLAGDNGPQLDLGPNGLAALDDVRQIL